MRWYTALLSVLLVISVSAVAQKTSLFGVEPSRSVLGAPVYPDAYFIRTISSLDPYYESVFYISSEPIGDVKNFFMEKLPGTRVVQYKEENAWVWTFILDKQAVLPDNPSRDHLIILERSHNIHIKRFQRDLYAPLFEYLEMRPDTQKQLQKLENGRTVIRYTYQKLPTNTEFIKLIGTWKQVDRDLDEFYGSIFEFQSDSTYTLTLTPANIEALMESPSAAQLFKNMSREEIKKHCTDCNPEKGRFLIERNKIELQSDRPVLGDPGKGGIVNVSSTSLSLQLINFPRLIYIRISSE
ncbi:hypothetical protein ACFL1R_08560 [Candidatus Latescibacterota bacterium]